MADDGVSRELVAAALRQDEDAARELVAAPLSRWWPNWCERIGPARSAEEDLCQMIFIKVMQNLSQFSGKVPLEHWVSRIAINTCINQIQAEKARPELREADLSEEQAAVVRNLAATADELAPDQSFASRELVEHLMNALKPAERLVIDLLYLQQRSVTEIQEVTGWSGALVKVRAFRARQKMKKQMSMHVGEGEGMKARITWIASCVRRRRLRKSRRPEAPFGFETRVVALGARREWQRHRRRRSHPISAPDRRDCFCGARSGQRGRLSAIRGRRGLRRAADERIRDRRFGHPDGVLRMNSALKWKLAFAFLLVFIAGRHHWLPVWGAPSEQTASSSGRPTRAMWPAECANIFARPGSDAGTGSENRARSSIQPRRSWKPSALRPRNGCARSWKNRSARSPHS